MADRCLFYTVELWRYWLEAHQIYIRCSLIIAAVNAHIGPTDNNIPIRFQTLVQRMHVVSVHHHYFLGLACTFVEIFLHLLLLTMYSLQRLPDTRPPSLVPHAGNLSQDLIFVEC